MAHPPDDHHAYLLFEPDELQYDFGPYHPMQSQRLQAFIELLETSCLWDPKCQGKKIAARAASLEELQLIHSLAYIEAVQYLSKPATDAQGQEGRCQLAERYGFAHGDTRVFPGMHEAAAMITGGTLTALRSVMGLPQEGQFTGERPHHVFYPAGGWHHAQADHASGFCVYNDLAVGLAHILQACEAKIAYIDFDAHHGDGVQNAFYDEPRIMTISLHETGRYLFPGTGDVLEVGRGSGYGYAVNIPLEPFTDDDSYIEVMNMALAPLLASFAPDLLVSMHGCDTHAWDPLSHLQLSMRGLREQARLAHQLAHTYCSGRWVAVGGGGYDLYRVVPRAWSMLWAEMSQQLVPPLLPDVWVRRWQTVWEASRYQESASASEEAKRNAQFPITFDDAPDSIPTLPQSDVMYVCNRDTVALVRRLLLPSAIRQAFPLSSYRASTPLTSLFDLLHPNGHDVPSRFHMLETARGTVFLRDFCPASLVERLHVEQGLHAFARLPEREHDLLLSIARNPDCTLTLAHTSAGEIIGQVTIAPLDEWWEEVENAYEIAIEVSSHWRGLGIARELLAFTLDMETLEEMLLCALGLSWHWDLEGLRMSPHRYRLMLTHLFATQQFVEYETTEPDIAMEPANVLLVRVGKHVDARSRERFLHVLLRTSLLKRQ
ncbi:GNAT family N-acetyltransferase [Ktedonospora formicarum]|uniref:Acetoin utilization protein AcuC n=1 Tax=Ktedonospora formicarum TaxID=2778364 RepID=A0A8J3I8E8_9CHLR|nr:GNAT family N-acetyltransferase [Ktedonospora formicarum]GHO48735.1 hypothetical protein KSX_68980 [Ktedonospora formicarum]